MSLLFNFIFEEFSPLVIGFDLVKRPVWLINLSNFLSERELPSRNKTKAHLALNSALQEAKTEPKEEMKGKSKAKAAAKVAQEKPDNKVVMQQQSYIMKLFDRSVNLAKFDENTPLYTIIRDWLKNAPRQKPSNESTNTGELEIFKEGDVTTIQKVDLKNDIPRFVKIFPKPDKKTLDNLDPENPDLTKEELLKLNKRKWSKIREDWCENNKKYKIQSFEENIKLIGSLKTNL